jgi:hypothetical protein
MSDPSLLGLLHAYYRGDRLARRALLDWLEENEDQRYTAVEKEVIDWDAVAGKVCPSGRPSRRRSQQRYSPYYSSEFSRYRWYVDCARFGSSATPEVEQAVREARRRWLQELFPEFDLSQPG